MGKLILQPTILAMLLLLLLCPWAGAAVEPTDPHGLSPAPDMAYLPHLPGLRNKTYRNGYGQAKQLSEAVVLRGSSIAEGQATVPAGGLFYISETSEDARPLLRDPFLVLGEHAYLVDLQTRQRVVENVKLKKGERVPLGDTGYRLWFDYATDHFEKPYAEFALISPSGGWPLEFPIASEFPGRDGVRDLRVKEGYIGQIRDFYLDKEYLFGASRFLAKRIGFHQAEFARIEFPEITRATFSMTRPIALELRQEDYRLYFDKRIYAFRRPDGFLVRVTDFWGDRVLGEKLIKPVTAQGYQDREGELDKHCLSLPEHDLRVEIMLHPTMLKHSDFAPWHGGKAHGWDKGFLSLVIYRNLITVEHGRPWPLDPRYRVLLEPNDKTGMLKRLVLENAEPLVFSNDSDSHEGPVKWSEVWNRPAFKVVASGFDGKVARNLYLRDYYRMRTDNMVFWPKEGRSNIDFFVGSSPVLEPILESTFLTRLADSSFGTVVEGSRFTSYPKVIPDASFHEPDHSAPFVPRLKGLTRKVFMNRKGERLLTSESVYIRGSYVDYKRGKIIIPPAGLCYSARNARNIRTLANEAFFLLGKKGYLASFEAGTFVRKNMDLELWKNQPMGDGNLMYWQDELLGARNKALRFTKHFYLDDRPGVELSLMKYSGNRWGAHFLLAQGLDPRGGNRYLLPEVFAEGATWIIPEYLGSNYARLKEFGTPSIEAITFTYMDPKEVELAPGQSSPVGRYQLRCESVDPVGKTVGLALLDQGGQRVAAKTLGPLDQAALALLPQDRDTARAMQLAHGDVQAELIIQEPFKEGRARLSLFSQVQRLERDTPYEFDPRFMVRPDVCGHCYQLNEILLDNPETIELDMANPIYEGPKRQDGQPLFRIVIDSFDGEMIQAWHIETEENGKVTRSENLAFRPRDNLDVLVGVNGTTEGFLRLSMLPRLGFIEYWRTGGHHRGERLSGSVNTGGSAHIPR